MSQEYFARQDSLEYLQKFINNNKARGIVAEIDLDNYLTQLDDSKTCKVFDGGWIISPKIPDFFTYRYIVFVLSQLFTNTQEMEDFLKIKERDRGFQSLCTFFCQNGIGVIVSGGYCQQKDPNILSWLNFIYSCSDENLTRCRGDNPFSLWNGKRGRPSKGSEWDENILTRFQDISQDQLTALVLRQAFYYGYLKQTLKMPLADPYDVDRFIVSYRGNIMPIEIKEKSPTHQGEFGIDAGRILMMLRLCLVTNSNALYIIRVVDNDPKRSFNSWKYTTLSDIIMGCSWNLQAGGKSMTGGGTQTIMLSGQLFRTFDLNNLTEEWLKQNTNLHESVRDIAQNCVTQLSRFLQA